jgi:hypothetical protein
MPSGAPLGGVAGGGSMNFAVEAARRFRAKADECRRRAGSTANPGESEMLLALAAEYDDRAAEAEALERTTRPS